MITNHLKLTPFRPIDTAWLHMAFAPGNTMIGGLTLLDEPITLEDITLLMRARLLRYRRFRQRPVKPAPWPAWPLWEDDPNFSLDHHIKSVELSPADDPEALRQLFQGLMSEPLPEDRPLWQLHLVQNYGAGSALILRFEHTVADGSAMMQVLQTLTDASPDTVWQEPAPEPLDSSLLAAVSVAYTVGQAVPNLISRSLSMSLHPLNTSGWSWKAARALGKLLFIPPDPETLLRGRLDTANHVAYSQPLLLRDIKAVGKALGATVNDILLSAVSGGFRHYLISRGEDTDGLAIRSLVPVDLRRGEDASGLGNKFGLVFLTLPVGIADPVERLQNVHENMDAIKRTPEAWVSYGVMNGLGLVPRCLEQLGVRFFCAKATATMTNVRGPSHPRYLAGRRINRVLFAVPHPGDLAIGMSIMSYAGEVTVTLNTAAGIIPNPQDIIDGFHADFDYLRAHAQAESESSPAEAKKTTPSSAEIPVQA